jgi:hypothetical protein
MEKWTLAEVAEKVDSEGGVIEAMQWGLKSTDIEDISLANLWAQLESSVLPLLDVIEDILSSVDVDEDIN